MSTSPNDSFFLTRDFTSKKVVQNSDVYFSLPLAGFDPGMSQEVRMFGYSLCSTEIGKDFTILYGPRNEMAPGKYKKSSAFYFQDGEGGLFGTFCETGDRGTSWFWFPSISSPSLLNLKPRGNVLTFENCPVNWITALEDIATKLAQKPDCEYNLKDVLSGLDDIKQKRTVAHTPPSLDADFPPKKKSKPKK